MTDKEILDVAIRALQEIYSGDEGPVLLRTQRARCARKYEAGVALRRIIRLQAANPPAAPQPQQ